MFRSGRPERLEDVEDCWDCACDCDCDCTVRARELRLGGEFPAIACREGCVGEARGERREARSGREMVRRAGKLDRASPMKDWQPCAEGGWGIECRGRKATVLELSKNSEDGGNCRVEGGQCEVELRGRRKWRRDLVRGRQGRNEGGLLLKQADNQD